MCQDGKFGDLKISGTNSIWHGFGNIISQHKTKGYKMLINEDLITQPAKAKTVSDDSDDFYIIEDIKDPDQKLLKKKIKSTTKNMKGMLV